MVPSRWGMSSYNKWCLTLVHSMQCAWRVQRSLHVELPLLYISKNNRRIIAATIAISFVLSRYNRYFVVPSRYSRLFLFVLRMYDIHLFVPSRYNIHLFPSHSNILTFPAAVKNRCTDCPIRPSFLYIYFFHIIELVLNIHEIFAAEHKTIINQSTMPLYDSIYQWIDQKHMAIFSFLSININHHRPLLSGEFWLYFQWEVIRLWYKNPHSCTVRILG